MNFERSPTRARENGHGRPRNRGREVRRGYRPLRACVNPDTARALSRLASERGSIVWDWNFGVGERAALRRRKPIPVSVWAERHRIAHLSSRPGPWRNQTTPYAAGIMDAGFFPSVRSVSVMKCPQSAGTEAIHNCVAYAIDRAPGPVLYVYPDESTARENARNIIILMIRASPLLREYLTGISDDLSSLRVKLAHLTIYMAWSGSASQLGNKPIRYLILDELDKYQSGKREASAEALAEKRVITWGKRAIIWKLSTPTVVDGPIDRALKKGTLANRLSIAPGDPGSFWLHSGPESLAAYAREMSAEVWNPEKKYLGQSAWAPESRLGLRVFASGARLDAQYFAAQATGQIGAAPAPSGSASVAKAGSASVDRRKTRLVAREARWKLEKIELARGLRYSRL